LLRFVIEQSFKPGAFHRDSHQLGGMLQTFTPAVDGDSEMVSLVLSAPFLSFPVSPFPAGAGVSD
jgi:hypothetical protein